MQCFDSSAVADITLDEPVIAALRRATSLRHQRLEAVVQLVDSFSLRAYVRALEGFELFLSKWEPRMRAALTASRSDWFSSRSRYHLIQRDLAHFGVERLGEHLVDGDCAQAVRDIELPSNAAAFGSMYVLEGSALGGQVIAKSAATTLGLGPDNGCAYFHGFHVDTAGRWKEFRALLESEVGNEPRARRQACDAARQTFDALTHMFERLGNGHTAARSRRMRG